MKKQLVLVAGLAVLAAPAFASKARLQALGEDTNGSFYINDNRNIFLNPSEVLNHKDLVTFESGAAQQTDADGNSNAEGGLFRAHGNMVYGVQFGRVLSFNEDQNDLAAAVGGTDADTIDATNALDLFVGGDAGIKWGVQLTYASVEDDNFVGGTATGGEKAEADVMDLRVGVGQGQWAAYATYGISGKTETKEIDAEIERKSAIEVGGSWKWDAYTAFAQYSTAKYDTDVAGADESAEASSYQIGVGRQDKLNDKATLFTKVSYATSKSDTEDLGSGSDDESKAIPVVVGLEYDAASWLAIRGSIAQNVIINEEETDGDKSTPNSTSVNTGASLKFGDLTIDGLVGTTSNTGTAGGASDGVLNTDNLLTRFSATYRF